MAVMRALNVGAAPCGRPLLLTSTTTHVLLAASLFISLLSAALPARADEIRLLSFDTPGGAAAYVAAHSDLGSTNVATGGGRSMVWVSCPGEPPEAEGMSVLGGSYAEVLADPDRKSVYDAILPPGHFDEDGDFVQVEGEDRRFGTFTGREEML